MKSILLVVLTLVMATGQEHGCSDEDSLSGQCQSFVQDRLRVRPAAKMKKQAALESGASLASEENEVTLVRALPHNSKILLIGDSNVEFAGPRANAELNQPVNTLQVACEYSTVQNDGAGGTSITFWLQPEPETTQTRIEHAISKYGGGWTHIWVCAGGNDLGNTLNCGKNADGSAGTNAKSTIKSDLLRLVAAIKAKTTAKIVFTGYAAGAADDICTLSAIRDNVAAAMEEIANSDPQVTYASMETAADGVVKASERTSHGCVDELLPTASQNPTIRAKMGITPCRGAWKYFVGDGIHLNPAGYAKAWALDGIQQAFNCGKYRGTAVTTPSPTPSPGSSTCVDNHAGVRSYALSCCNHVLEGGCESVAEYCNDADHGKKVKENCPVTCKTCTTAGASTR